MGHMENVALNGSGNFQIDHIFKLSLEWSGIVPWRHKRQTARNSDTHQRNTANKMQSSTSHLLRWQRREYTAGKEVILGIHRLGTVYRTIHNPWRPGCSHTQHNGQSPGQMWMYSSCSLLFMVYFRIYGMIDISVIQFEGVPYLLSQSLGNTEIHCKKDTL